MWFAIVAMFTLFLLIGSEGSFGAKCFFAFIMFWVGVIPEIWWESKEAEKRRKDLETYDPEPNWQGGFASYEDVKGAGALVSKSGLTFGTWYPTQEAVTYNPKGGQYKPILVFGGMGSGKTTGVMIPAALGFRGSEILIEATGETAAVAGHNRLKDGPVYSINPMGILEENIGSPRESDGRPISGCLPKNHKFGLGGRHPLRFQ